jgi:hypothetical protein
VRRSTALLATPLVFAAWLSFNPLHASADSQTACVPLSVGPPPVPDPTGCKTVTVDANGALTSGSTSGNISFGGTTSGGNLAANTSYTLIDAIQTLATSPMFVGGSYTLSFASPCTTGSVSPTSATYTVVAGAVSSPPAPPSTSPSAPLTITTDGSGNFNCDYTLTYPTIDSSNDTLCNGHLCSVRNDVFLNSTPGTFIASASVPPGGSPPTSVPEAPWAILIPAAIVLTGGLGLFMWRRKLAPAS